MSSVEMTSTNAETRNLLPESSNTNGETETNKERRDHMRHLQKEAFQLANYYFVFQGVIFTAFYNFPSVLKCRYHWVPFTLSFIAGFINLCALTTIACKYKTTLDEIDRTAMGRCTGPGNDQTTTGNTGRNGDRNNEPIAVKCERHWRLACVLVCMGLFVGFFVVTLIGCWKITCG